jgi:hypothetical protein
LTCAESGLATFGKRSVDTFVPSQTRGKYVTLENIPLSSHLENCSGRRPVRHFDFVHFTLNGVRTDKSSTRR